MILKNLVKIRKQKGWSQEKLAVESNISYNTIIKIEREGIKKIDNYITKPFTKNELLRKINDIIGKKEKVEDMYNTILRIEGEKLAKDYKRLHKRILHHKFVTEALEKAANLEGIMTSTMRMTLDNEKKMIEIWNRKINEIPKMGVIAIIYGFLRPNRVYLASLNQGIKN